VIAGGFPDGCDLRLISKEGQLTFFGKRVYVTKALAGYEVGLLTVGEIVQVWFHDLLVGGYDPQLPDKDVTAQPIATTDDVSDGAGAAPPSVTLPVSRSHALPPHNPDGD
jgi:hypothetical protein